VRVAAGRRQDRRAARRLAPAAAALAAVALTSACGSPAYRFVANDDRDVVLRVPSSWSQVDTKSVLTAEGQPAPTGDYGWLVFYDASPSPDAGHVRAAGLSEPLMTARSLDIPDEVRATLTDEVLMDLWEPVTPAARDTDRMTRLAAGQPERTFRMVSTTTIHTSTERGFHLVFSYSSGPGVEYFDQVAVTDPDRTRVHTVMVRCSAACFRERRPEIDAAVRSLTVKNP
jgi:hypothetical protein